MLQNGKGMVVVFRVRDGQVKLDRYANTMPLGDLPICVRDLRSSLAKEFPELFR